MPIEAFGAYFKIRCLLLVKSGRYLDGVEALYLENGLAHAALGIAAGQVLGGYFLVEVVAFRAAERERNVKAFKLECFGHDIRHKLGTLVYLKFAIALIRSK